MNSTPTRSRQRGFAAWATAAIAVAGAFAGCATAPGALQSAPAEAAPPASPGSLAALDCTALRSEIARTEDALRSAEQKEGDAWKAVIPFAVVARYGSGRAAAAQAEERLAELRAQAARQACERAG